MTVIMSEQYNKSNHFIVLPNAKSYCTVTEYIRLVDFKDIGKNSFRNHVREKTLCVLENKLPNVCV